MPSCRESLEINGRLARAVGSQPLSHQCELAAGHDGDHRWRGILWGAPLT